MALQGNLHDMSLADLIQQSCQDRKVARLSIDHQGQKAVLYFGEGSVQHASLGEKQGEEVVFQALAWEDGTFTLDPDIEAPATTITRSWSGLLMEGAQRLDENLARANAENRLQANLLEESIMAQKLGEVLKEFVQEVPGLLTASVVGMDGLAVAEHITVSKVNSDAISSQLTLLIKLVDTSVTKSSTASVEEDLLTTQNSYMMLRFLPGKDFFLAVTVDRKVANLGNLRLMSRVYGDRLAKALPR